MSAKGHLPEQHSPRMDFSADWGRNSTATRSVAGFSADNLMLILDEYMIQHRDNRIKTIRIADITGKPEAESCSMIGGDGISDKFNKTSPTSKYRWIRS